MGSIKYVVHTFGIKYWCIVMDATYFSRILDRFYIKNVLEFNAYKDDEYFKLSKQYNLKDSDYTYFDTQEQAQYFIDEVLNPIIVMRTLIE